MAGARRDAKVLKRALRGLDGKTDRKNGGDHGVTTAGPTVPPGAAQTVAEAT